MPTRFAKVLLSGAVAACLFWGPVRSVSEKEGRLCLTIAPLSAILVEIP